MTKTQKHRQDLLDTLQADPRYAGWQRVSPKSLGSSAVGELHPEPGLGYYLGVEVRSTQFTVWGEALSRFLHGRGNTIAQPFELSLDLAPEVLCEKVWEAGQVVAQHAAELKARREAEAAQKAAERQAARDEAVALGLLHPEAVSVAEGGSVHLGNYLGAIRPALQLADRYHCVYFIADYHALTTNLMRYNASRMASIHWNLLHHKAMSMYYMQQITVQKRQHNGAPREPESRERPRACGCG